MLLQVKQETSGSETSFFFSFFLHWQWLSPNTCKRESTQAICFHLFFSLFIDIFLGFFLLIVGYCNNQQWKGMMKGDGSC
jgi:hypothetical protein